MNIAWCLAPASASLPPRRAEPVLGGRHAVAARLGGRPALAPLGISLVALVLAASPCAAQGEAPVASAALSVVAPRTIDRPETPVVIAGARLRRVAGAAIADLRLVRVDPGPPARLRQVPFQVDERTPEGAWALDLGDERRRDSDDRHLDGNDELALRAGDAGARAAPGGPFALEGKAPLDAVELELKDPLTAQTGWLYLLRFEPGQAPPAGTDDRVALEWRGRDLVGWRGDRFRCASAASGTSALDLRELKFAAGEGWGPDVLDRAKLAFAGRYLFLDIARRLDEVRVRPTAWRDGPVRAIVRLVGETYLIWGHWIRTTRCELVVWGDRVELDVEVRLPVALERDAPSDLRLAFDMAPEAGAVRLWSDRNRDPIRGGSRRARELRDVDATWPRWIVVNTQHGSLLGRLRLGPGLGSDRHGLLLLDTPANDPPEDAPGALLQSGWRLDLSGLAAGTYQATTTLQVGPPLELGEESRLLRVEDAPVLVEVR